MNLTEQLRQRILKGIPGAEVSITTEDEVHFKALVIAEAFAGKNTLQRHRMVYHALGNSFEQGLHAMELKTLTPEQTKHE